MYQIVLFEDNKKIKVLHTYTRLYDANNRLEVLRNRKCYLPKKVIYRGKDLFPVVYKTLLLKKREDGDKSIIVRDSYGRVMDDVMSDPDWCVINESPYQVEEMYNCTGANRKLNALEIVNHVLLPNVSKDNTKQVFMLNNKVVIEGSHLHMITCKTLDECIRLYNIMRVHCYENKLSNILFFGSIHKVDRKLWYKKINEATGVGYNRLYRIASR